MKTRSFPQGKAALSVLALGGLLLTAACGGTTTSADSGSDASSGSGSSANKTIAFSPLGLQIPAMQDLAKAMTSLAEGDGYTLNVQDPALDPQKQLTQVQSVVDNGSVGGAFVMAVQPSALTSVVKSAQEKGIPLLLNGTPEDYGLSGMQKGITFDNIDYEAEGEAAGTALGDCINEKLDGKAEVIFAESAAGTAGKSDYEGAVKKSLAATAPDATIVSTITVSDRATAQTDVGNALQGHPDVQAVFGQNDEGTLGAIGAFKAAGKTLSCATETGGNDEALAAVESGEIYAVVALQFADDMAQSFTALTKMMADPTAEGSQLLVPMKVIKADS